MKAVQIVSRQNPKLLAAAHAEHTDDPRTAATIAVGSRKLYRNVGTPAAEAALKAARSKATAEPIKATETKPVANVNATKVESTSEADQIDPFAADPLDFLLGNSGGHLQFFA
jgi:hypothetical protein